LCCRRYAQPDVSGYRDITKKYGKPTRIEPSEYGFQWYVYGKNYKKFLMAGVDGSNVAAAYSYSVSLKYNGINPNSSGDAARKILGTPITHVAKGNLVSLIEHPASSDEIANAYQRISIDLANAIRVRNGKKTVYGCKSYEAGDGSQQGHAHPELFQPLHAGKSRPF
jgi:hypothetical protein